MYIFYILLIFFSFALCLLLLAQILIFNRAYLIRFLFLKYHTHLEFTVYLDWIRLIFLSVVSLVSFLVLFYRYYYIGIDKQFYRFYILVILFISSIVLLIISPNIFRLLLGWDGLGLVSYALVSYYQNQKRANSGVLTVLINRLGDVFILFALCTILNHRRARAFAVRELDSGIKPLIFMLIFIGGATKRAQVPFSSWLPAAIAAPTPVSSLVHSSTLVTAGIYLFFRFNLDSKDLIIKVILIISLITLVLRRVSGITEIDLKKVVALSTLSQLGIMLRALGVGAPLFCFFHLRLHAFFKSLIFLCVGILIHSISSQDSRKYTININRIPVVVVILNISSLSLRGAPFFSGFVSKDYILDSFYFSSLSALSMGIIILRLGLTGVYSFRLLILSSFHTPQKTLSSFSSRFILLPLILLRSLTVSLGRLLNRFLILERLYLYLFVKEKLLVLRWILFGIFTRVVAWKTLGLKFLLTFLRSVWYSNFISQKIILTLKINKFRGNDRTWLEFLGGKEIYNKTMDFSNIIIKWELGRLNFILMGFFFWTVALTLLT